MYIVGRFTDSGGVDGDVLYKLSSIDGRYFRYLYLDTIEGVWYPTQFAAGEALPPYIRVLFKHEQIDNLLEYLQMRGLNQLYQYLVRAI